MAGVNNTYYLANLSSSATVLYAIATLTVKFVYKQHTYPGSEIVLLATYLTWVGIKSRFAHSVD